MANIRIRPATARISDELNKVVQHAVQYSGVDVKDAPIIENDMMDVIQQAARLAGMARVARGYPKSEEEKLVRKIRKALGYTYA
jgi:hypothetical protein